MPPMGLFRTTSVAPVLSFVLALAADAAAKPGDPADRGLDLFVHAPKTVRAGDNAVLDLLAYGFVTVTDPKPLEKATIIATWDPESLGAGIATAPGDITGTTDARGHATISVPMPDGDARQVTLLVSLRHGEHVRTRKIHVKRTARQSVSLRIADPYVVPGSRIPAWVTVTDTRTGDPVKNASVEVSIREGDLSRQTERVVTDNSGLARTALWIPAKATGTPPLALRARLAIANNGFVEETVGVALREERPATPKLLVVWRERQLKPGEVGHATIDVLDAAGEPIANHAVRYWSGPKGTTPPTDENEWKEKSRPATTDGLGHIDVTAQAPRVVTAAGSSVMLVVKTELESQTVEKKETLSVGLPIAEAQLDMESGEVVPGAKQRAYLHVTDGEKGVAGAFLVEADGLKAQVTTDKDGDGELTWTVPEDIGAARGVGPCAGGVAAAVTIRQVTPIPALSRHPEPFESCVRVIRERAALLRPSVYVARVGDKPTVKVEGGKRAFHGPGSVAFTASDGTGTAQWTTSDEATIDLTNATPGVHDVSFAAARLGAVAETSQTQILVVPKVLPKLHATLVGGKLTPGSDVDVDVVLDDGHGHPLVGSVSAVVIDKEGGGSISGLHRLDTRLSLCAQAHAGEERCDAFLEGDPSAETLRRASLSTDQPHPLTPELDPAADAKKNLKETFSEVLHSLEGAVFQAQTPESLRDVRRKENGRWVFNPELMTLVTAAMQQEPITPGGDPFRLNDLIAVDPQVSFDVVARRVTRLKLFNVLSMIRSFVFEEKLGPNEPALRDPNALLRRLVRDNKVEQHGLLDPWGGTFEFVRSGGAGLPFLTVSPGWELHAPGPDGRIGTGDDVRDPFERVVRSGSPYAEAMGEDEIVDSRLDMRVGDATVSKWQEMFDRLTGQVLGNGGGTGNGQGFGSGHGRLGGSHTTRAPSVRMGASIATNTMQWTDAVRTDANGRARVRVHLGDYETTWQIGLLARSDVGQSALAAVDAPAFLPVSAHMDLGRKLTQGDALSARIVVRNRTAQAKSVSLDLGAEGGLALANNQPKTIAVEVPANAVRSVYAKYNANAEGLARATVTLRGAGIDGDRSVEEIRIEPAGEPLVITNSIEVAKSGRLRVPLPAGWALRDQPRLVIESGLEGALVDAMASFEPDPGSSPETLASAIEVSARIEKLAEARNDKALVTRTRSAAAIARMYLGAVEKDTPRARMAFAHSAQYPSPEEVKKGGHKVQLGTGACPSKADIDALPAYLLLETEPPPPPDGPPACYTTLAGGLTSKTPLDLARATIALADRPHRTALAENQARELAKATFADGGREPTFDGTRAEKAIVLAALSRTASAWSKDESMGRKLGQTILTLRDARGGYGSAEATRDVVRAFVALESQFTPREAKITVVEPGRPKQTVDVAARGRSALDLAPGTTTADVFVTGGPVVVRLERPVLRRFLAAPETTITPVQVAVEWPPDAKANATGVVHVSYTATSGHEVSVHTQLPLPPGVELAGPVQNGVLRQGVVHLTTKLTQSETISIPVRFSLPGTMLVPEAETRTTSEEQPRTLSPARWLTVH